jgi:serine/threonine-protein kinase
MLKKKLTEQNRRYKSGKVISRDSFTVAVGVVYNRTGTTHLAFLLNSYLNSLGVKSIYIERNTSGHLTEFLNREGAKLQSDGIWRLKGNSYLTGAGLATIPEIINYKVVISDYGVIELEKAEMWEAGLKLITAGGKVWETESIRQVLPKLGRPSVKVLLNYLNGKQFRDFLKNFGEGNFIRIPYEPDPFNPSLADEMKDFLDGLIEEL